MKTWRRFDPKLYDELARCKNQPELRDVTSARKLGLIPQAIYQEELLSDSIDQRFQYFSRAFEISDRCDLLFFDPDNGLQIESVPMGRKNSSKFLYWAEVEKAFSLSKSILVYQHFARENRASYILRRGQELAEHTPGSIVFALETSSVLFLLAIRPEHVKNARNALDAVSENWLDQFRVVTVSSTSYG